MNLSPPQLEAPLVVLPELAPVQIDAACWSLFFTEISYLEVFPLPELGRALKRPPESLAAAPPGLRLIPLRPGRLSGEGEWLPPLFWADFKQHLSWAENLGPGGIMAAANRHGAAASPPLVSRLLESLKRYQPAGPAPDETENDLRFLALWLANALNRQSLDQALNTISQMENRLWAQMMGEPEAAAVPAAPGRARWADLPRSLAAKVLAAWFRLGSQLLETAGAFLIREAVFKDALAELGPPPLFLAEVGPGREGLSSALLWLRSAPRGASWEEWRGGLENRLTNSFQNRPLSAENITLEIYAWAGPARKAGGREAAPPPLPVAVAVEKGLPAGRPK